MADRLPQLMDARTIMAELDVKRATAEKLMRQLPKVRIDGHRKAFVRREDVARYLAERTAA